MQDVKASVQQQFGNVAVNYATSTVHASGEDLNRMVQIADLTDAEQVLDAGCGAGHTALAFAPHVAHVVAYDLTASMLEQVERLAAERHIINLSTRQGDVEVLPFANSSFDVVVSRYSAHHWPHPAHALAEFKRVLKPNGQFILSDIVAAEDPTLDTFLQTVELLRDPSHVRDHSISQWTAMLHDAGFTSEVPFTWQLPLDFDSWVTRMATPPANVAILKTLFDGAPSEVHNAMDVQPNYRFQIPGALFRGRRNY
ncbi:MAG: class I SAM-dependent methyltransferase [Anaerolineae bacterium]|nr:class I SAM-dependent methyltransferase [Anaerolineae bacterium]